MDNPIAVLAEFLLNSETLSESRDIILELRKNSKTDEGCLYYELFQDPQLSNRLLLIERWASKIMWDNHMGMDYLEEAKTAITPHLLEPIKVSWWVEQTN